MTDVAGWNWILSHQTPGPVLLRGGAIVTAAHLALACETAEGTEGVERSGFSTWLGETPVSVLDEVYPRPMPSGTCSFSTLEALVSLGLEVQQTSVSPHHTVWVPDWRDSNLMQLITACFGPSVASRQRRLRTADENATALADYERRLARAM